VVYTVQGDKTRSAHKIFLWENLHIKISPRHIGVKAGITLVNIMAVFGKETSSSIKLGRIRNRAIHAT